MKSDLLIYGVSGRLGGLVSRLAAAAGQPHVAAGRDLATVLAHADRLLLPHRVFALDHLDKVERALAGVAVVLNAAGPFGETAARLAEACLSTRTHYLDLSAEAPEIEGLRQLDRRGRETGIMLMPGAGLASDALAARLKRRLPGAVELRVARETVGGMSRASWLALLRNLRRPGMRRVDGELLPARPAEERRRIDLGGGPRWAVTDPWAGELVTAWWSAVMPNIETYTVHPPVVRWALRSGALGALAGSRAALALLRPLVRARPSDAGDTRNTRNSRVPRNSRNTARAGGSATRLWVQVEDGAGRRMTARLRGPEAGVLAAHTALWVAGRVLAGQVRVGFQTPATAYGPDLVDRLEREVPGLEVAWSAGD